MYISVRVYTTFVVEQTVYVCVHGCTCVYACIDVFTNVCVCIYIWIYKEFVYIDGYMCRRVYVFVYIVEIVDKFYFLGKRHEANKTAIYTGVF